LSEASFRRRSRSNKPASILMPLCKTFGPTFLVGSCFQLLVDVLQFVSPQILRYEAVGYNYKFKVLIYLKVLIYSTKRSKYNPNQD
jgi:hypothetical protein